jgi:hypothetical protein
MADPMAEGKNASEGKHHHHHHIDFAHEFTRARQFLRPDGKKIHVANSPGEVEPLRRRISTVESPDDFDIVIHGSADHVTYLRQTHEQQEKLRDDLRRKHGPDFDEFERVVKELDRLSNELHAVSEHAVNLDANFSKYGYSAHLRTIPKSGETSEATSLYDEHEHKERDWKAEKNRGEFLKFFKKPVMRQ